MKGNKEIAGRAGNVIEISSTMAQETFPRPQTMERNTFESMVTKYGGYSVRTGYVPPKECGTGE